MPMSVVYAAVDGVLVEGDRGGIVTCNGTNTLGSVTQTNDASGAVTSETEYWPFGEVRTSSGTNPSPWGFCGVWGYYKDTLVRLYVRMRTLRTDLSEGLAVDLLWPEESAYGYAHNSPLEWIDSCGTSTCLGERPEEKRGVSSCYSGKEGFKNCCTACGQCFTEAQECSNGAAALKGSGFKCGDMIRCCLASNKNKCWDLDITNTGSGRAGRIVDLGCCFATKNGVMDKPGLVDLICTKTGSKKLKRNCSRHTDCGSNRGKHCK